MTLRLWLVRHGATDWSQGGRFTGWNDVQLNASGREQASQLADLLDGRSFISVWSSDLMRCRQTAALAGFAPSLDARLRELNFGALEGRRWHELEPDQQRALVAFDRFAAQGGESVFALRQRVLSFVAELPPGEHLVFTHGGVLRLLLRERSADAYVPPGSVVVVAWPAMSEPSAPRGGTEQ